MKIKDSLIFMDTSYNPLILLFKKQRLPNINITYWESSKSIIIAFYIYSFFLIFVNI